MQTTAMPFHVAKAEEQVIAGIYEGEHVPAEDSQQQTLNALGSTLLGEFDKAVTAKQAIEERLLKDLRQYKGVYDPLIRAILDAEPERSDAFFRKTRAKVKAVNAKMCDLLLSGKRAWDVKPKQNPRLPKVKYKELQALVAASLSGDGRVVRPEDIPEDAMSDIVLQYAAGAAEKMVSVIEDQLAQAKWPRVARRVIHSGNLYGLGIAKGPLVEVTYSKEYAYDEQAARYVMKRTRQLAPFYKHVPIWRYYPDLEAVEQEDCRYEWEHHRITRASLAALADRKPFKMGAQAIREWISAYPTGHTRLFFYEAELRDIGDRDMAVTDGADTGLYDVFERTGWLTAEELAVAGVEVPADRQHEAFYANVWLLPSGHVIKCTLPAIEDIRSPYKLYQFDEDETSIFCEGIAAIMRDDQRRLNAAYRAVEDNLGITSGPQVEVNTDLVQGLDAQKGVTLQPFGVWFRTGKGADAQYPAVRSIDIASRVGDLMAAADRFDQNADEATQIPKLIHGEGPAEAASALSMRLGQINIAMKDLVLGYEEGVGKPAIEDTYAWNMKFHRDDDIKGDFEIAAGGASTLVAQEVQAQQAMQFGASVQPGEEKYVDRYVLLKKRADLIGLSEAVRDRDAADAEANSGVAQVQQQIALDAAKAELARLQAEAAKKSAEATLAEARALNEKMGAAFAAMQAGGVAAASPAAAAAGDSLLRSGGWRDAGDAPDQAPAMQPSANPQAPGGEAPQMLAPEGLQPADPNAGQNAGIQTPQNEGLVGA